MVYNLALANLFYLSLVLQPNLGMIWSDQSLHPWLPGIALVFGTVYGSELSGLIWACVLGVGVDCLSIHRLGIHTIVATCLAVGLILATSNHRPRGMLTYGFFVFAVTFFWLVLAAVLHGLLEAQAFEFVQAVVTAISRAFSTTLLVQAVMIVAWVLNVLLRSKSSTSIVLANRWTMLTGK